MPLMIAIAPNGARKTQQDHPAIPIISSELAHTAAACLDAGACMIHLHIRDENQAHSLDPQRYKDAIRAVRDKVGDKIIVQITTEAVGIYKPEEQIDVVKTVKPEAASIALKEFCPDTGYEIQAARFFEWMYRERVAPQYILYDEKDIKRFNEFCARGLIPGGKHTILLVLGRYTKDQQSDPDDLDQLVSLVDKSHLWWLCAFGKTESLCMANAMAQNGHCRVGFENNMLLPDGSLAKSNSDLVDVTVAIANSQKRAIANADQARELMGFRL